MSTFEALRRAGRRQDPAFVLGAFFPLLVTWASVVAATELPATRLRIRISERGVYELSPADLAAAGVPVVTSGVDPRTLRLLFDTWKPVPLFADSTPASWQRGHEMREAAIWIPGEDDGRLDPEDRLVFYALGPAGWDDHAGPATDPLAHSEHPYDRFEYGWLVWGGAPGLRMEERWAAPPEPLSEPPTTRVPHREHREEDRFFAEIGDLWAWEAIRPYSPPTVEIDLDLGGEVTATGTLRLQLGGLSYASQDIQVQLNGVVLGIVSTGTRRLLHAVFESAGLQSRNTLVVRQVNSNPGPWNLLDLDATWERPLAGDGRGELSWSTPLEADPRVYEMQGLGTTEPLVLDVTERSRPLRLTSLGFAADPARWRVLCGGSGARVHLLAARTPRRLNPQEDLELRDVAPLRSRASSPDMLIVTHPDLLPAAERLAAHRRSHFPGLQNPDILVTTTRDIYDNFSGGRMDPLAIRNAVKFLYGLSGPPRLAYLLLFGDATRDPRQVLPSSPPTLVPTVHAPYADSRIDRAYAVDDWFGAMSTPSGLVSQASPQPEIAIGRLPARDPTEAEQMVDKILAYETSSAFGPWRGRILIAADDECQGDDCHQPFFVQGTEDLTAKVPEEFDLAKVYMTEFPLVLGQKPEARAAFIRSWNAGCTILNYYGHGAPRQLADEVLFLSTDIPSLTNGDRLPLFLSIGCNVSQFDFPERQSICEMLVAAPNGGAIATIGATWTPYVGPAYTVAQQQFTELFREGATTQQPIGLVHRKSKGRATPYNEHFVLLGDPALVLRLPRALVTFTSGADELVAGHRARVEGIVHLPGSGEPLLDFDGLAAIEVLGNSDESGYERTDPPLTIPYVLPGEPIYRGQVEVHAGRFAIEFTVPPLPEPAEGGPVVSLADPGSERDFPGAGEHGALFGPGARVAAYAWTGAIDAKGGRDGVLLTEDGGQDPSLGPPVIRLAFPGNATRVSGGTELTARIEDENGIWIAGTAPASCILLRWDDGEPIDVTTAYRATGGTDVSGTVYVPMPGLAPGPHRATLSASDNLGNPASASLEFEIVDAPVVFLSEFRAGPNPMRAGAEFAFLLDVPADIELRVFSVDGRQVFLARQHHDGLRRGLVQWNGKSTDGYRVASGVYLYRLEARPAGGPAKQRTGKLAVLR